MQKRVQRCLRIAPLAAIVTAMAMGGTARAQRPAAKPFENTYRRPTVSPYLNLQQQGMNPLQNQNIYQTMVQPQLEQQRQQIEQLNQRRQMGQMQSQMRQIQQSAQARQLDETIRPTGHAAGYLNYSHYYRIQAPQR